MTTKKPEVLRITCPTCSTDQTATWLRRKFSVVCDGCGKAQSPRTIKRIIKVTTGSDHSCDAACLYAAGETCACVCQGKCHGAKVCGCTMAVAS